MDKYNHKKIEKKWQEKWAEEKIYQNDMDEAKKPYYNLMMFPYPSAEGLHVGNMYAFTGSDIWGRYQRMQGKDCFEPMGLDGFGIHSENYAIKIGEHIGEVSKRTEKHFYEQLHMIGNGFDWSRTVETYKPSYYKWTQWLFVQMYKNALAYRKKATVNWCPSCKTVLSDEQVEGGRCERCKSETTTKDMEQWFWRITDYAERLLKNLEWINWSEEVKLGQKNWIGKSEGAVLIFKIQGNEDKKGTEIEVFTTRPDTIYGATFMVIAPEHSLISDLGNKIKNIEEVRDYVKKAKEKSDLERTDLNKDKTGINLEGIEAINPATGKAIPIYVADYVLISYGKGAIMGVPAHDERDYEFAKKYDLKIVPVIEPPIESVKTGWPESKSKENETFSKKEVLAGNQVYPNHFGKCINSVLFDGLAMPEDNEKIIKLIEKKGWGKRAVTYKLRDWCISRQRYWGDPIPMVKCEKCGWQPIKEEDLPVKLPEIEEFKDILPDGSGKGPLAKQEEFVKTKCPRCGEDAERETDVMDPFVDSSWYFFRYPSTEFEDKPFDKKRTKKWLPVDMYIGGKEHTVLHLLYSRFVTMALKDWGYIDFEEPYERFFGHGLLIKEGSKMSKSKGNVINPDEYIGKYGADAVRMYLMFLGDFSQGGDWRDTGMEGMARFIKRVYKVSVRHIEALNSGKIEADQGGSKQINICIKKVTEDIKRLSYNTSIAHLMTFFNARGSKGDWGCKINNKNELEMIDGSKKAFNKEALKKFILLLAPFAPHITEELWEKLGNEFSIHEQAWPEYDEKLIKSDEVTIAVQINGKLRDTVLVPAGASKKEVEEEAKKGENVQKYLKDVKVKKVVFVEDKIVSFVV
jgi:leucyl-tRNA synthetase